MKLQRVLFIWANALCFVSVANALSFAQPAISNDLFSINVNTQCNTDGAITITDHLKNDAHFFYVPSLQCPVYSNNPTNPNMKLTIQKSCFPNFQNDPTRKIHITNKPFDKTWLEEDYTRPTYVYTVNCSAGTHYLEKLGKVSSKFYSRDGKISSMDPNNSPVEKFNTGSDYANVDLVLNNMDENTYAYIKHCELLDYRDVQIASVYKNCEYSYPLKKVNFENQQQTLHFQLRPSIYYDLTSKIRLMCTLVSCKDASCAEDPCKNNHDEDISNESDEDPSEQ